MELYQKSNNIYTWLYFYLHNSDGSFFVEHNLLPPNFLLHTYRGVFVAWKIAGYPGTKEAREYFNDIIARFLIAYKEYKPERLDYNPNITKNEIKNKKIYELKDFQNLPSLNTKRKIWTAESVGTIDQVFWAIKIYTEQLIKDFGEGIAVPYQMLEDYAITNFYDRKDRSTLKAKCRNIWNWYNNRNWVLKKEWKMTRSERARKNAELKKQRARAILLGFIQDNLLKHEYIKKDGSWNITKLAKATKLSRPTIITHLKELKSEGII